MKESNLTLRTLAKGIQEMNKICIKLVAWVVVELGTVWGGDDELNSPCFGQVRAWI